MKIKISYYQHTYMWVEWGASTLGLFSLSNWKFSADSSKLYFCYISRLKKSQWKNDRTHFILCSSSIGRKSDLMPFARILRGNTRFT